MYWFYLKINKYIVCVYTFWDEIEFSLGESRWSFSCNSCHVIEVISLASRGLFRSSYSRSLSSSSHEARGLGKASLSRVISSRGSPFPRDTNRIAISFSCSLRLSLPLSQTKTTLIPLESTLHGSSTKFYELKANLPYLQTGKAHLWENFEYWR